MGVTRVVLWVVYCPSETARIKTSAGNDAHPRDSVAIEMSWSQCSALERIPSRVSTGSGVIVGLATSEQER